MGALDEAQGAAVEGPAAQRRLHDEVLRRDRIQRRGGPAPRRHGPQVAGHHDVEHHNGPDLQAPQRDPSILGQRAQRELIRRDQQAGCCDPNGLEVHGELADDAKQTEHLDKNHVRLPRQPRRTRRHQQGGRDAWSHGLAEQLPQRHPGAPRPRRRRLLCSARAGAERQLRVGGQPHPRGSMVASMPPLLVVDPHIPGPLIGDRERPRLRRCGPDEAQHSS
mmetsp:Transcript_139097/g.444277  ORF Transcript_139097/g.444277 Transcript_139097/m.444277 type:complete len:221 (-) Transcript_139097:608-1270(-)